MHNAFSTFVVQAIVIVALSRGLGLAARRLRQPMVVAEILAGIVLGPSLLGTCAPGLSHWLFPSASLAALGIVSQLGLVLFMFLIGLELDPRLLQGRGRASVVISHSSIIVPFALGAALAVRLHGTLAPAGTPFLAFAAFMGVAMSITAFPVLARILTERGLLSTEIGAVTIACAAIDDITAWCLLAFVVSIAKASGVVGAVVTTGLTLLYVAAMSMVFRPVLARVAARQMGPDAISQQTVAVTLVLLLISSITTESIGIHALFGAFAFGMTVPRTAGFARALAEKIEDLAVVLLLPLFFAYSGLRTQVGLIHGASGWLTCAAIVFVACVGKFGGSYAAARWTGLPAKEATILGLLMNTRGLMELVALNIGLDLGVISPTLFTMMVLMAVITTMLTSPLLSLIERTSAAKIETEPSSAGIPVSKPTYSMLICTAYERSAQGMLAVAGALASPEDRVYALRLLAPNDRSSQQIAAQAGELRISTLSGVVATAAQRRLSLRPLTFISTDPARDICDVAAVKSTDFVLLGWHRSWFGRSPLGGTVQRVLGRATGTVAVLLDRGLGARLRSALVILQGTDDDEALRAVAERMQARGCAIETLAPSAPSQGAPVDEAVLTAASSRVDLVLVGLAGPLADGRLLDRLTCSVLLIRRPVPAATPAGVRTRSAALITPALGT